MSHTFPVQPSIPRIPRRHLASCCFCDCIPHPLLLSRPFIIISGKKGSCSMLSNYLVGWEKVLIMLVCALLRPWIRTRLASPFNTFHTMQKLHEQVQIRVETQRNTCWLRGLGLLTCSCPSRTWREGIKRKETLHLKYPTTPLEESSSMMVVKPSLI